jgi:ribosomal-protein-alanine N-acetyltransferase
MAGVRGLSAGAPAARAGASLPEIRTERLVLRVARPGMERPLAEFLAANFPGHLDRWSPPVGQGFFTEAFWREKLRIAVEEFHTDRAVRMLLQPRAPSGATPIDAPVIGTCNYTNVVRGPFQACHLGYQIALAEQGKGLMQEALRGSNRFMFEERRLHRIMANYRPENHRSARLLERLGFQLEGLAKDYLFIDGAWRDHVLTALANPDFDPSWIESAGR